MFLNKTKYEPKVGDKVIIWSNVYSGGKEATRLQKKPESAILESETTILQLTQDAVRLKGLVVTHGKDENKWMQRDRYYLERIPE